MANVGNHLHLQIKLSNRYTYKKFIRAVTSAIMMAVTGINKWTAKDTAHTLTGKFWDLRPFTRILTSFREHRYLQNYLAINRLEAQGYTKNQARFLFFWDLYGCRTSATESG